MRINIDTKGKKFTDPDLRCLIILLFGMSNTSKRMIEANLKFIADKYGYKIIKKDDPHAER